MAQPSGLRPVSQVTGSCVLGQDVVTGQDRLPKPGETYRLMECGRDAGASGVQSPTTVLSLDN